MTPRNVSSLGAMRTLSLIFAMLFGLLAATPLCAQHQAPSSDNGLTPADPIGSPDYTPALRDHETVSLTSLDLSLFLPVLSLPQRGGNTLTLGYYHNASQWRMETDVNVIDPGDGNGSYYIDSTYNSRMVPTANSYFPFISPLQINLPTLTSSIEYVGDSGFCFGICYGGPTYCEMGWAFTDWEGNMHSFESITSSCNGDVGIFLPATASVLESAYIGGPSASESDDASFYHLDASNWADLVVTDKSGVKYHFTDHMWPFVGPSVYTSWSGSMENRYQGVFSSMVDPNGNTVTITGSSDGYLLTDTTGKKVDISPSGISYKDSNGVPRQVSVSQLAPSLLPPGGSHSDSATFPDWSCSNSYVTPPSYDLAHPQINFTWEDAPVVSDYTTYQVSFPQADGLHARTFTYIFDGLSRVIQARYPSGGYTRYQYASTPIAPYSGNNAPFGCWTDRVQVVDKYECANSSGSCSTEAHTQYGATPPIGYTIEVRDPVATAADSGGTVTDYAVGNYSFLVKTVKDSSGAIRENITNSFVRTPGNPTYGPVPILPTSTVDTVYTSTGSVSKTTNHQYQYIPYNSIATYWGYTDNPTQIDEYDFDGSLKRSTTNVWADSGIYAITASNHILDRLGTSLVTDKTSTPNKTVLTTYSYDSYANITSKSVGGSDGSQANTILTRNSAVDPYHRVTQATDPNGNSTTYSYTDGGWSNSGCAPSTNSYAFLTSATNAKGQTHSFSYNSCTGTLGSSTDVNGKTTAYAYDAIGRSTAVCYPDAVGSLWSTVCVPSTTSASVVNTYDDSIPNSVVHSVQSGPPTPSVQTKTIFDGDARPLTSLLISDPEGTDETDTTYDLLGRVATVSNPYRLVTDPTYGITAFQYDWAGRKTVQLQSDTFSSLQWCYNGIQDVLHTQSNCKAKASSFALGTWVDSEDEIGNDTQHVSDALGRLSTVTEPSPSSGTLALETDYTYDGHDDLLSVNQIGASGETARTRSFIYDSFSRLTSSTNSETGTIGYSYYLSGSTLCAGDVTLPCSKTDARGVTTNYSYDSLNRLLSKTYTGAIAGTQSSCYAYDTATVGVGRLGAEWTQTGSCPSTAPTSGYQTKRTFLAYDAMGRIASEQQCAPSTSGAPGNCTTGSPTPFALSYTYDFAGKLNQYTNGVSSILFTPQYDGAGRLSTLTSSWSDSTHPAILFTADPANGYTPAGGIQNVLLGDNITVLKSYDNRLRTTGETATHP